MTKEIDWDRLEFRLTEPGWMYRAEGQTERAPVWDRGAFEPFGPVQMSPAAAVLSYGYGVFEGMKAERGNDGVVRLFRPDRNAARFQASAERLAMPPFPADQFLAAVAELVRREHALVPPAGKGAFYVRPMMHAVEPMLGLTRARQFAVTIYGSPVGDYFAQGSGIRLKAVALARVAPGGTGAAKAMGNYPGATRTKEAAQAEGFDDVLFGDAAGAGRIGEASGANFFAVMDDGELVTPPLDDTILAGITRESVIHLAQDAGLKVSERPLTLAETMAHGREAFCTGTAWSLRSVASISSAAEHVDFLEPEVAPRLRDALRRIQTGDEPDPRGWGVAVTMDEGDAL